jgi:deoxyadenosine/deoxycytidine kinase
MTWQPWTDMFTMGTHVGIVGNIGAGKTTLMSGLATLTDARTYTEGEDLNPFMEDFYRDPHRWALASALFFLNRACEHQLNIRSRPGVGLQDRTAHDQLAVFIRYRERHGILRAEEAALLRDTVELTLKESPFPDLYVYVRTTPECALSQINSRARGYESGIPLDLLCELHELYEDWILSENVRDRVLVVEDLDLRIVENVTHVQHEIQKRLATHLASR